MQPTTVLPLQTSMASKPQLMLIISTLIVVLQVHTCNGQSVVKAGYWFPDSGVEASDIDSSLFTHLFCAFSDLDSETNTVTISSSNSEPFSQFTSTVQLQNPSVKTLLSIGGGGSDAAAFSSMASQSSSRKSFIDSSISLARDNGFHGLDLDWEYPESASDMRYLGSLLKEWRSAVAAEASDSGETPLLLTAAVSYTSKADGSYSYPSTSISRSLDWINVMDYDFYAPDWYPDFTNCHAGLYDPSGGASGSSGIQAWRNSGVAPKKLVLGIPFYGYVWRLVNSKNHGILAPAKGPVDPDNISMEYREIMNFINQHRNAVVVYNSTRVCNYCYSGTTWIGGYDDVQSVSTKVSFAKQNGLLGYFAWHVGADYNWKLSQEATTTWAS